MARPVSYGLVEDDNGPEGEASEWALQTTTYDDCRFYEGDDSGWGACQAYEDRPLICETHPFSVAFDGTSQPMDEAVDEEGIIRAHEHEGLDRDTSRADAEELARMLRERVVRELREARDVTDACELVETGPGEVIVRDSEGAKRPGEVRVQ